MSKPFKEIYSLVERKKESSKVMTKYNESVPVITNFLKKPKKFFSFTKEDTSKNYNLKFLFLKNAEVTNLINVIRKRNDINPNVGLYLSCNDDMINLHDKFGDIYNKYKDEDGFLYIDISEENTFG